MKVKALNCLFPDCENTTVRRGLCHTHYNTAAKMINRKKTSWEILIRQGKATDRLRTRGRPSKVTNWFSNGKTK